MKTEYYRMEYEAWDEGTDGLSLEQEGAYLRLCHQMYRRRGPVANQPNTLSRIWRCHPNKARSLVADLIAQGKVALTPEGHLTNTRVTQELHARETQRTQKVDAGRVGGEHSGQSRAKQLKLHDPTEAPASVETKQNEATKRREEEQSREEIKIPLVPETSVSGTRPLARRRNEYPEDFAEFWEGYPTDENMSKAEAFDVWKRTPAKERLLAIESLPAFRAYCAKEPTYRPVHANRYLSKKRFEGHAEKAKVIAARTKIRTGTPEWEAWRAYYVDEKKKFSMNLMNAAAEAGSDYSVASRWPPGREPREQAA